MANADKYDLLDRRHACGNSLFEVFFDRVRTPSGGIIEDFLIVRPRVQTAEKVVGICVLPEVEGRIGLMRGYRHQLGAEIWQAPAGFVEAGEEPARTAMRELEEEATLTVAQGRLQSLGKFIPDAGLLEGWVALFVAREAVLLPGAIRDMEIGGGSMKFFSREELRELCGTEDNVSGATLAACYRYLELL